MIKENLVLQIKEAFQNVKLLDGIGIWEAQGIDDYADLNTIASLRSKDEREHWQNIPYQDLITCASSLSFFDDKGMLFCLPQFLLFDLEAVDYFKNLNNDSPDVLFILGYNLHQEYQKNRFSLFNKQQIQTIIDYLKYKLIEYIAIQKQFHKGDEGHSDNIFTNYDYLKLIKTIREWEQKFVLYQKLHEP